MADISKLEQQAGGITNMKKLLKDILIILMFVVIPIIIWFLTSFGLGWLIRWLIYQD